MRYLLEVAFHASPSTIEVQAESFRDAWNRRYELAAHAEPVSWQAEPLSLEEANT